MRKTKYMLRVEESLGLNLEEYLREEYHNNKKTIAEISKDIGVKNATLKSWFGKLGIPTRNLSEAAKVRYEGTSLEYRQNLTRGARKVVDKHIKEGTFWLRGISGEHSPTKRPEVRKKNSEHKKKHNPMFIEKHAMKMRKSMEQVLRDRATIHELLFKEAIEARGYYPKFQHAEYKAVLDFAFIDKKIGIEIDGDVHYLNSTVREKDEIRDKGLKERGWEIIRIPNKTVEVDLDNVIDYVIKIVDEKESEVVNV